MAELIDGNPGLPECRQPLRALARLSPTVDRPTRDAVRRLTDGLCFIDSILPLKVFHNHEKGSRVHRSLPRFVDRNKPSCHAGEETAPRAICETKTTRQKKCFKNTTILLRCPRAMSKEVGVSTVPRATIPDSDSTA